jgi:acyl carrier protein
MENKVLKILTDIQPEYDFKQDVNFIEEGMIDSFDMVNLVSVLDEEFGISIDGVDIVPENFFSLEAIVSLLKKKGVQ